MQQMLVSDRGAAERLGEVLVEVSKSTASSEEVADGAKNVTVADPKYSLL